MYRLRIIDITFAIVTALSVSNIQLRNNYDTGGKLHLPSMTTRMCSVNCVDTHINDAVFYTGWAMAVLLWLS